MGRRRKGEAVSGWVCLDKPHDLGSTQAVGRVRRAFNAQKAGHAGTLDPMATGVLVIGMGDATRLLQYVVEGKKAYDATISLGTSTITDKQKAM